MKKDMNVTVTLTPQEVRRAIARYVTEEFVGFNAKPDDVEIAVGTRLTGYGPNEIEEPYLRDVTVKITKTETKHIVDNYQDRNTQSFHDK